jgi:uncharacterized protein YndB with AHSA1/START domain
MSESTLSFEKFIQAPSSQVYRAFTNATALREWMCDGATVVPRPGGRFYAWWNAGYYACGEYTKAQPDQAVAFTWHGRGQSVDTQVHITIAEKGGGALLKLAHSVQGTGSQAEKARQDFRSEWPRSLENLASVLESGQDLRFVRRPMLGIQFNEFNPEIAKKLSVPVKEGIRLDDVIAGMGAAAAGLTKDDVLISMAGRPAHDFASLTAALQGCQAGDTVEVVFYRGPEKKTVQMQLSGRPLPEIPDTPAEMARRAREIAEADLSKLEQVLGSISEAEAAYKPAPEEWSVKEILAHLIHSERGLQSLVTDMYAGYERVADDFGGNIDAAVMATVSAFPTLAELLQEYKRSCAETNALIAAAPPEFVARKGSYTRLGYYCLDTTGSHVLTHLEQIEAAVQAARKAKV